MSDKVKIDKINIAIGDKVVELTPEEAKDLSKILTDLFGEKEITKYYPIYIDPPVIRPWLPYTAPYITTPYWSVTYNDSGNSSGILSVSSLASNKGA